MPSLQREKKGIFQKPIPQRSRGLGQAPEERERSMTPARSELLPIINKIGRSRPILSGVVDLWRASYTIDENHTNCGQLEKVLFGDLFNGQYQPREFLTARETWITRYFYNRGASTGHQTKENNNMTNFEKPTNGASVGVNFNGPMWSPIGEKEAYLKEVSGNTASFTSPNIRGELGKTEAFGRPHFTIDVKGAGVFLLPDHAALMSKLEKVEEGAEVWIGYDGMTTSEASGRQYHSYEVIKA